MRAGGRNPIERFSRGPGLTYHHKVVGRLEKGTEARTNDLVIIEKKDSDTQFHSSAWPLQPTFREQLAER